jgi:NTE family protein
MISGRVGLVLGAGGMVGLAYHAGVLRALAEEMDFVPSRCDVIVGTSAGSVMTAYLRSGHGIDELWELALGTHASFEGLGATPTERRAKTAFTPAFGSALDFGRRAMGSTVLLARSLVRFPTPRIPDAFIPLLKAGLFTMDEAMQRFESDFGTAWPAKSTRICAVDVGTGRRVVFGSPGAPTATLPEAVMASCAVPGLYVPPRINGRTYVDGGVHSSTNLDVAARAGCEIIVCIAPMAYDPTSDVDPVSRATRRIAYNQLAHEVRLARSRGVEVLMFRPTGADVRVQGINLMRPSGAEIVAESAYEEARSLLRTDRYRLSLAS